MMVNKNDDVAEVAAVNAYPKGKQFSGNYTLKCDVWINYNGSSGGGVGSTEYALFGINHTGAQVNWRENELAGDGIWFATTGEGGAARDFRSYQHDGATSVQLMNVDAGLIGTDNLEKTFQNRFPAGEFETGGAIGKRWIPIEVRQKDGMITWLINGYVIASRPNSAPASSGTIMLGCMDIFTSIASPKEDNFVLFDNVRVINLDTEPAPSAVKIEIQDEEATEPGTNTGKAIVSRSGGDLNKPLTVTYRTSGTAQAGKDYETLGTSVTIPANQESTEIVLKPMNDQIGEPDETVDIYLTGTTLYDIGDPTGVTFKLLDDGDITSVQVRTSNATAYERMPEDTATIEIYRMGDTSQDLNVKYILEGTATNGQDYELLPNTAIIPAGTTNVLLTITPKDDLLVEGNETVICTLLTDAGYKLGTQTNTTATIFDNDQEQAPVLFTDNFDRDSSANWQIQFGSGNNIQDYEAIFGYDYSAASIPPAPGSSTTTGLKMTVNKSESSANGAAGINVYPKGQNFSGNYALQFNMFLTYNAGVAGTTEHAAFGINHSGNYTNRHAATGSDGLWYAIETDGSASGGGRSYTAYIGDIKAAPAFTAIAASQFAQAFTAPPYKASGAASGQWVDGEVIQHGQIVTMKLNGTVIFQQTNSSSFTSGTAMLGYMDTFNSIGSADNFVIFDNVRVIRLPSSAPKAPQILSIVPKDNQWLIEYEAPEQGDIFILESASTVGGPYSAAGNAVLTSLGGNKYRISIAKSNQLIQFYRLRK